jgi:uncharacterized protein YukJ
MPLKNYHLLKAKVLDYLPQKRDSVGNEHTEILLEAQGEKYQAALNFFSSVAPHELLTRLEPAFRCPELLALSELSEGLYDVANAYPDLAIDYIYDHLVSRDKMCVTPVYGHRGIAAQISRALELLLKNTHLHLYAFGEAWGPHKNLRSSPLEEGDAYFHFKPEQGIHSLHLNQGQSGRFSKDNGRNQDGMLLFENADLCSWTACFFAFQAQSWENDASGNPITS